MPTQPSPSQVQVINPVLSTHAQGFIGMQSQEFVWNRIAPPVPVGATIGQILEFGKESFQLYNSTRAPGANTKRVNFGYLGKPFSLRQKSLEGVLPREHIRDAAAVLNVDLEPRAVNVPLRSLTLEVEYEVAQLISTAGNYPAGHAPTIAAGDKWTATTTSNPIIQMRNAKDVVRSKTGMYPNTLVLSPSTKKPLEDHPAIVERLANTQLGIVTEQILAQIFDIPNVFTMSATWANDAGTFFDVLGNFAWLGYVPNMATYDVPAFAYTYTMEGHPLVEASYYDNNAKSYIYPVTYERNPVITGNIAGYLFVEPSA